MKISNKDVDLLILASEKNGCENARFIIINVVVPKAEKQNCCMEKIIESFKSEDRNTHKYKLYWAVETWVRKSISEGLIR